MSERKATVLLEHCLKQLKLPTILREYAAVAAVCGRENKPFETFLLQLCERELIERQQRATERRIKAAAFGTLKTIESFDFAQQPGIKESLVRELLVGEFIDRNEPVLLIGNSGTGKTHLAVALGLAACHEGRTVRFFGVTSLVTQLLEAREDRRLERMLKQLGRQDLLILDSCAVPRYVELRPDVPAGLGGAGPAAAHNSGASAMLTGLRANQGSRHPTATGQRSDRWFRPAQPWPVHRVWSPGPPRHSDSSSRRWRGQANG